MVLIDDGQSLSSSPVCPVSFILFYFLQWLWGHQSESSVLFVPSILPPGRPSALCLHLGSTEASEQVTLKRLLHLHNQMGVKGAALQRVERAEGRGGSFLCCGEEG